jgi:hypothetical protein
MAGLTTEQRLKCLQTMRAGFKNNLLLLGRGIFDKKRFKKIVLGIRKEIVPFAPLEQ